MIPDHDPDQLRLFPSVPGAEQELTFRLIRERSSTGHTTWRWDVKATCHVCGPVALGVGPVPPFAGAQTIGAAAQRLIREWCSETSVQPQRSTQERPHEHGDLLQPFHQHLEMHHTLE